MLTTCKSNTQLVYVVVGELITLCAWFTQYTPQVVSRLHATVLDKTCAFSRRIHIMPEREIVWKRHFCRNNLSTVSKRNEMKTERLLASCQHKRRYFFVPILQTKHLRSQNGKLECFSLKFLCSIWNILGFNSVVRTDVNSVAIRSGVVQCMCTITSVITFNR